MRPHLARRAAAVLTLLASLTVVSGAPADDPRGLKAEIYDAPDLSGVPVLTRVDATIDDDWELREPVAGVGDDFSVRWTGTITPRYGERYTFITRSDDGVRLWVGGKLVIDDWRDHAVVERSGQVDLFAGVPVPITLEYYDIGRRAVAQLSWRSATQRREVVPAEALSTGDPASPAPAAVGQPAAAAAPQAAAGGDPADDEPVSPVAVPLPPPAPPVAGETFNAAPLVGEVLVRRPEDGSLVPLQSGASLPVGTRIDARRGKVRVTTAPARGVKRKTQYAKFSGAMFRVGQRRTGDEVVDIDLMHGDFEACAPTRKARARAASAGPVAVAAGDKHRVRSLWGSGKGRFRTRGRNSVAIVRGTVWNVVDRCDGTFTRVKEGVVDVHDLARGRTVEVRAGESYLARPR